MKNRLLEKIGENRRRRQKIFCAFLTLGYPSLRATHRLIREFEKAGVDILELGIPFSDPLADGPTIQFSSERALKQNVSLEDAFRLVARLRKEGSRLPILAFSYLNPIFHYGPKRFAARAAQAGFDGLIVPDLPPEEEAGLQKECRRAGLLQIFLVAPTTEKNRAQKIARRSRGFIYYVSLRGVTGARKSLSGDIRRSLGKRGWRARKPVLVGFGVSAPEQARALSRIAGGVIVGSAIIDRLRQSRGRTGAAVRFIRKMVQAVKGKNSKS